MLHETIVNPPWCGRREPARALVDGCVPNMLYCHPFLARSGLNQEQQAEPDWRAESRCGSPIQYWREISATAGSASAVSTVLRDADAPAPFGQLAARFVPNPFRAIPFTLILTWW